MDRFPHRLSLPTGLAVGDVNAYLFTAPEPVLIDTGVHSEESWEALNKGLANYGLIISDLVRVIISHPHIDHFGQARRITENGQAEIWIADLGYSWIADFPDWWGERQAYYRENLLLKAGFSSRMIETTLGYFDQVLQLADPVPKTCIQQFQPGDFIPMGGHYWKVIHTPGHASTQTCFYQADTRQFISADMLMSRTPTPIVETPSKGKNREPSLPKFLQSLDLVEALAINQVYPGHGDPFKNHLNVIQNQRARIKTRKEECFALIESGYQTISEILDKMYAHFPPIFRMPGLWMLIGYLDLLKAEGRIVEQEENGIWKYQLNNPENEVEPIRNRFEDN